MRNSFIFSRWSPWMMISSRWFGLSSSSSRSRLRSLSLPPYLPSFERRPLVWKFCIDTHLHSSKTWVFSCSRRSQGCRWPWSHTCGHGDWPCGCGSGPAKWTHWSRRPRPFNNIKYITNPNIASIHHNRGQTFYCSKRRSMSLFSKTWTSPFPFKAYSWNF